MPDDLRILGDLPTKNPYFQKRENISEQIVKNLSQHGRTTLVGPAKYGKTHLAWEYVSNTIKKSPAEQIYSLILWFDFEKEFLGQVRKIMRQLPSGAELYNYLRNYAGKCLVVFDNYVLSRDQEKIRELNLRNDHIIITSRQPCGPHIIHVPSLKSEESQSLIASILDLNLNDTKAANSTLHLGNELDHHPEAIVDAAIYIRDNNISLDRYLKKLVMQKGKLIPSELIPGAFFANVKSMIENITSQNVISVLQHLAYMNSTMIPWQFFVEFWKILHPDVNPDEIENSLNGIVKEMQESGLLAKFPQSDDWYIISSPILEVIRFHFLNNNINNNIIRVTNILAKNLLQSAKDNDDRLNRICYMQSKMLIDRMLGLEELDRAFFKDEKEMVDYSRRESAENQQKELYVNQASTKLQGVLATAQSWGSILNFALIFIEDVINYDELDAAYFYTKVLENYCTIKYPHIFDKDFHITGLPEEYMVAKLYFFKAKILSRKNLYSENALIVSALEAINISQRLAQDLININPWPAKNTDIAVYPVPSKEDFALEFFNIERLFLYWQIKNKKPFDRSRNGDNGLNYELEYCSSPPLPQNLQERIIYLYTQNSQYNYVFMGAFGEKISGIHESDKDIYEQRKWQAYSPSQQVEHIENFLIQHNLVQKNLPRDLLSLLRQWRERISFELNPNPGHNLNSNSDSAISAENKILINYFLPVNEEALENAQNFTLIFGGHRYEPIKNPSIFLYYSARIAMAIKHIQKYKNYPDMSVFKLKSLSLEKIVNLLMIDLFDIKQGTYELNKIKLILEILDNRYGDLLNFNYEGDLYVSILDKYENLRRNFELYKTKEFSAKKYKREEFDSKIKNFAKDIFECLANFQKRFIPKKIALNHFSIEYRCSAELVEKTIRLCNKITDVDSAKYKRKLVSQYRKIGKYYLASYRQYKLYQFSDSKEIKDLLDKAWKNFEIASQLYHDCYDRDEPILEIVSTLLGFLELAACYIQENMRHDLASTHHWTKNKQRDYFLRSRFVLSQLFDNTYYYARRLFYLWQILEPESKDISFFNKNIFDVKITPTPQYYQNQLVSVEHSLQDNPDNIWLVYSRAVFLLNIGMFEHAIILFNQVLETFPYSATTLAQLGLAYFKLENYLTALFYYRQAQIFHGNHDSLIEKYVADCQEALNIKQMGLGKHFSPASSEGIFISTLQEFFAISLQSMVEKNQGTDNRFLTSELVGGVFKSIAKLIPNSISVTTPVGLSVTVPNSVAEVIGDVSTMVVDKYKRENEYRNKKIANLDLIPADIRNSLIFSSVALRLITMFQQYFYFFSTNDAINFAKYLSDSMIDYLSSDRIAPYLTLESKLIKGAVEGKREKVEGIKEDGSKGSIVGVQIRRLDDLEIEDSDIANLNIVKKFVGHMWTFKGMCTKSNISTPDGVIFTSPHHEEHYLNRIGSPEEALALQYKAPS